MLRALSRSTRPLGTALKTAESTFPSSSVLSAADSSVAASSSAAAVGSNWSSARTIATPGIKNNGGNGHKKQWELLHHQGYDVNPCNSKFHPAVEAGINPDNDAEELPVQEAYTPESACFGCGPAAADGLHLRSFRVPGGLEATVTLDPKYCAFPGIINGGIISALFDCQGNWTAAIALMDRGCLPKPPLTLTSEILVKYLEPTPHDEPLIVHSQIVRVTESGDVGSKATVQVDLTLSKRTGGTETTLARATGLFKKLGALRAL